jgi:hypothetical protein
MQTIAGCRLLDRARADRPAVLRFVRSWGPLREGDVLELPGWDGDLQKRGVRLGAAESDVIAVDADGDPALVVSRMGSGTAVVCSQPVELLLAGMPDAHGPDDRTWGLYAGLAELAGIEPIVAHPDLTTGTLLGAGGGLVTITNHSSDPVSAELRPPEGDPSGIELDPYGSSLVTWDA